MILTSTRCPLGTFRLFSGELSKNYLSLILETVVATQPLASLLKPT